MGKPNNAHEMCTFFEKRRYSPTLLKRDLQRVSHVSRRDAIQDTNVILNGTERIPLVLLRDCPPLRDARPVSLLQNISTSLDKNRLDDMVVRCVYKQCRGTNAARRHDEMA